MASRNPFALLSDDGDASDSEQKTLPKPTKPVTVDAAPKTNKAGGIQGAQRRSVPGQTATKPQKEVNELPASGAAAGDAAQFEGERGRDTRGTGFGRGRGGARGGRGGDRDAPRGDRPRGGRGGGRGGASARPDRHSQTGKVDSEKAEHQGWGGDDGKRELEAENAGVTDAAAEKGTETPVVAEGEAAPAPAAEKAPETPAEPEDNSKTYEEFLKEQKSAGRGLLDSMSLNARKANEGADDSQWKDGVAITKGDDEKAYFSDLQKEKSAKARKERKEKTFLEVEFAPPARQSTGERGGRGGFQRGGGRGGRGRGDSAPRGRGAAGPRGGRGRGSAPTNGINLSDAEAFPSLG